MNNNNNQKQLQNIYSLKSKLNSDFQIDDSMRYSINEIHYDKQRLSDQDKMKIAVKYVLISNVILAFSNIFIKLNSLYAPDDSMMFNMYRHIGSIISALIYLKIYIPEKIQGIVIFNFGKTKYLIIIRSICLLIGTPCYLIAMENLKLSISSVISLLTIYFMTIMDNIVLKKPIKNRYYLISIFIIMVLVLFSTSLDHNANYNLENLKQNKVIGVIMAVIFSFVLGVQQTTLKLNGNEPNIFNLHMLSGFWCAYISLIYCILVYSFSDLFYYLTNLTVIYTGLCYGSLVTISVFYLYYAFNLVDYDQSFYYSYIVFPLNFALGYFLFNEKITITDIIGFSIIVLTLVIGSKIK